MRLPTFRRKKDPSPSSVPVPSSSTLALRRSPSSASPSPSGSSSNLPANPRRHALDSSTNVYKPTTRSSPIPRGNGHQALSIPMPPPPSLYFSLLPSGANAATSTTATTSGGAGSTSSSTKSARTPRPSLGQHASVRDNSDSDISISRPRPKSKSTMTNLRPKQLHPQSDSSTSTVPPSLSFTPLVRMNSHSSSSTPRSAPNSRPSSNPTTPGIGPVPAAAHAGGYDHHHTHHHAPRSTFPLSMTHSRRSSLSHVYEPSTTASGRMQKPGGFFDMAIFDPAPEHLPRSARASIDHDGQSRRVPVSRPPSIESINSANSVPFAPPPPPPPSVWKQFTSHFSHRVVKRHIKFIVALYISSAMALVPSISRALGTSPYMANVAVVFMHPSRTVGSQLEVTIFSVIGGVLAAVWILPCQVATAAFNQKYLPDGNNSAWAIDAAWFFVGVWIMTSYKARYAKLNCSFIIYTIAGIFALTRNHTSMHFDFHDFWGLMGPMMLGVGICLVVSILLWPETASEGLGTRFFLLNHNTIALPKSAIEKAQAEVRTAQKKLFSAYREARYEVTYSMTNPADYKEVRLIISALMRHLGSMSLVVQNERLLMLGHPDRDDQDLVSQSGSELSYPSSASDTESDDGASESEADHPSSGTTNNNDSGEKIHHQSDYFGDAIAEGAEQRTSRRSRHGRHNDQLAESPTSEDGHSTPRKRVQRRGSAAELRRIRQLLQRAENSTQATMKARQRHQERLQKDALQQPFQFGRDGTVTAPPTPGGRGVFNVFGHHQAHRSRTLTPTRADNDPSTDTPRQYLSTTPSNISTPNSSKPNSIYEEQNLETIKSFKSLFSIKSASKFKPNRPASLKAGFKLSQGKRRKDKSEEGSPRIPLEDMHYATVPENGALGCSNHYTSRNGLLFQTSLTDHQIKKAAESFRKQREKEAARQRKLAEREVKAEQQRAEKQRQAEAAARAVPPKEVAFGDRKLFMSFLDIVHNPLQRLSDSCSRVMVAMERELVAGLNVEQDRLERIRRRNAQRVNTIRAAEAKMTEEGKAGVNGTTTYTDAAGTTAAERELTKKRGFVNTSVLDRIRALVGIKPSHMTKGDLEYVGALKSGMVKDKEKNVKPSKNGVAADTVHPNKFLQQDAQRNATCSGIDDDDEDELMLPPDMSYVQYLSQELEIFDKAEAEGLRDFIATHPTLDVGPREELFLIFFFLFALREIARELLRLGKHMEEIEERERRKMEEDGRTKRRKQLWWPKVFGNFWHWFAWGSYTQVKTSEGHNALVLNTTKNLEHRQPRTIEEEKALVEAKTAKAVAERAAAEASAKAVAERKAEHRRRRHSEMWDLPPLRRAITLSAFVHRKTSEPDLELGPVEDDHQDENRRFRRSAHGHLQGLRSRSNSPFRSSTAWSRHCEVPQHYGSPKQWTHNETDLGDPSILRGKEVLDNEFGEEEAGSPSRTIPESLASTKSRSKRAEQYTVVEIPDFKSLQLRDDQDLKHFEDVNVIDLMPRVNGLKLRNTAPPELDIAKHSKSKKSHQQTSGSRSPRNVILSAPSSTHQDRYPSFACSTPPSLLPGHHESDSTFVDSHGTGLRAHILNDRTDDHNDRRSSTESGGSAKDHHRRGRYGKDAKAGKSRFRGVFSPFSCSTSNEGSKNTPKQRQRQLHPASEPIKPARTTFVSVNKPKTLRYRFWEFLQPFKSEDFKFGFKMAVALTFIGLWSWLQWNSVALATDRGQWAMITVMAVLSPTVGATFSVCAMRIAGTLIGTLWALLTFLALPKNPYVICAMMLVIAFAGVFLILESAHPKLGIIMLLSYSSITFIMYEGHTTETIYQVCYKRAITVIIGIIISVIMNSLLWPILARRELRKEIAILIGRQGVLFAELVNKFLLEDPQDKKQGAQSHYAANWPQQDDLNGYASDELNEETLQREDPEEDQFQDSFVERAEREARMQKQQQQAGRGRRRSGSYDQKSGTTGGSNGDSGAAITDGLQHQTEDSRNAMDPDRLAFQHVEHQLQTKLIKISELLELSGSEPRLKEEFPMKLYNQIVQCCQNILDRMISMRMAAQLLSPEVRELVTGPMNYYRRDMVS
ncbi:hypothetical protein BC939DRAFT_168019 [Gamsiella multidivaricata]|uniref:uncharacterized protein n=1 Tax=Gamsiella multidivaricata TaxID=101098 RepID=UPI00221E7832|nr:uncharacterized protein BC939DRAFT_168019 [Gamsiella multidivaricata]KAI7823255.1 hypothetical protein BC939DRAFT_168019 [Gamsiella multidivaricata]